MPAAYRAAEDLSARGQTRFRRWTVAALVLLVAVAVLGLVDESWAGWAAAAAFAASVVLTGLTVVRNAEDDWYDGRAVAESAKTLTWKYAVGGEPYGVADGEAADDYRRTLGEVVDELRAIRSAIEVPAEPDDLGALTELRGAPLAERRAAYRQQRLEEQRGWYQRRGNDHRRSARTWQGVAVGLEAAGVAAGALKGLDVVDLDLLSVFAAAAAGVLAWLAAGDFQKTARAYGLTTLELDGTLEAAKQVGSEEEWARFVADAEQTMSREHTTWLARRRGP